jgi:3-hydroxy acid dehydrogenase/malonic semialdehyde reductase
MTQKTVLITGATSGIGEACAREFASHGYRLIITGRRIERLENLADELLNVYRSEVFVANFDISKKEEVKGFMETLPVEWQDIDVLVNNAGLCLGLNPIQEGLWEDWDTMIDTNVKGLLWISKLVSNLMIRRGHGHIINISSISGKEVYANGNVYCATKHAVDALTKGMRIDLVTHNIKVSSVNPGAVETEFSNVRFKGDTERAKQVYQGFEPLKPEDIAQTVYYVSSLPPHVTINDVTIMPTAQASCVYWNKQL